MVIFFSLEGTKTKKRLLPSRSLESEGKTALTALVTNHLRQFVQLYTVNRLNVLHGKDY